MSIFDHFRQGPQERAAQAHLDEMPDEQYRALGRDEAERLSDEVWAARGRDITARRGDDDREIGG